MIITQIMHGVQDLCSRVPTVHAFALVITELHLDLSEQLEPLLLRDVSTLQGLCCAALGHVYSTDTGA
jgi:hypothetical protein